MAIYFFLNFYFGFNYIMKLNIYYLHIFKYSCFVNIYMENNIFVKLLSYKLAELIFGAFFLLCAQYY